MDKEEELLGVRKEVEVCRRCPLHETRTKIVFGAGPSTAKIMIVSEAPGYFEDKQGVPFVGKAGKVLDELLASISLKREEVYIANCLKCRPPNNRDPEPPEIKACTPYLDKQIALIKPKILATLGNFATSYIMEKFGLKPENIGKVHGKVFKISNLMLTTKIIPMYHPAAVLRNPGLRATLVEDFKVLKDFI